jgi:hypothetical protein
VRRRPPLLPGRTRPPGRGRRCRAPAEAGPPDPTGRFAERARRKHELVHALRAEGRGLREIARHLRWGLHTVQRYDRAATWQEPAESRWPTNRPSKLDPFKPYPDQHAAEGHGSFTRLFHEVKALGYDGSYSVVRNYLDKGRPEKAPLGYSPPRADRCQDFHEIGARSAQRPPLFVTDGRARDPAKPVSACAGRAGLMPATWRRDCRRWGQRSLPALSQAM